MTFYMSDLPRISQKEYFHVQGRNEKNYIKRVLRNMVLGDGVNELSRACQFFHANINFSIENLCFYQQTQFCIFKNDRSKLNPSLFRGFSKMPTFSNLIRLNRWNSAIYGNAGISDLNRFFFFKNDKISTLGYIHISRKNMIFSVLLPPPHYMNCRI